MKKMLLASSLVLSAFSVIAADNASNEKNSFSCMDKQTFEVDAKCISTKIETSDSFSESQKDFYKDASEPGDYVMATVLMDPKTLDITVIAYREKQKEILAKIEKRQSK